MKVLFSNLSRLLESDISIIQRGLLISIILLKDKDSAIWDAKLKAKIKVKNFKEELLLLHEANLIEWKGYKTARKALDNKKDDPKVLEVIQFMNNLYGRNFNPSSNSTITGLKQRLVKYSIEDIMKVISNRWEEWSNDEVMKRHLNPTTIFRESKFEKYLEEVNRTDKGAALVQISKLGLEKGDEITPENVKGFIDREFYFIKVRKFSFGLSPEVGMKIRGDALKIKVKLIHNKIPRKEVIIYDPQ